MMNSINGSNNNIAGRDITIHNYPNGFEKVTFPTKDEALSNLRKEFSDCKRSLFVNRRQLVFLPTTILMVLSLIALCFLAFHFVYDLLNLGSWQATSWISDFYFIDTKQFSNPLYMMIPAGFILLLMFFHKKAVAPILYNISLLKSEIQSIKTEIQRVKTRK